MVLKRFFLAMARMLVEQEEVWTLPGYEGAAIWAPPGDWHISIRDALPLARLLAYPSILWRLPLVGYGLGRVELHHPRKPHFYLADLGTDPDHRGKGVASALLAPTLQFCDREGAGAYLECSNPRNVAFYTRHGFRVSDELRLPRGPVVFPMWREPLG
jgi:GNAT superfamily N-acetyltransferase